MKKHFLVFLVGISGGLFAIGALALWAHLSSDGDFFASKDSVPVHEASYTASDTGGSYPDFTVAAEKVMDAVVHIKSIQRVASRGYGNSPNMYTFPDEFFEEFFGRPYGNRQRKPQEQVGTGSGVIIKENGYIITNNHVIEGADEIQITLHDNRSFEAKVVGTDPSTDLALLKIDASSLNFVPFTNSDEVKVGQWVMAVGNPFNLNSTVTAGIVSAKGRNINILKDKYAIEAFIQTDAAINPGNSGGALVNLNGELVGINTAIASPTGSYSGYGFAIPSNIVKRVIGDLIEFGSVQRAFLGVSIRDVDATLVKEKGLEVSEGIYVESMQENSAAEKAGVVPGDVIVMVESSKIKSVPQLQEVIASHKPGDVVKLIVNRAGKEIAFDVKLTTSSGTTESLGKEESSILTQLGISISDIDAGLAKRMGIAGGVKVQQISSGIIGTSTDMKPGCIIVKIDRQQVTSTKQFVEIIKAKQGGILLECRYENSKATYYYGVGLK